jgi:hypothetical protein
MTEIASTRPTKERPLNQTVKLCHIAQSPPGFW